MGGGGREVATHELKKRAPLYFVQKKKKYILNLIVSFHQQNSVLLSCDQLNFAIPPSPPTDQLVNFTFRPPPPP